MRVNKKQVAEMANTIYRKAEVNTISEAFKVAWKALKLQSEMLVGDVEFTYKKINGEIRKAKGTLKFMAEHIDQMDGKKDVIQYYDLEKKGFRSFVIVNLI